MEEVSSLADKTSEIKELGISTAHSPNSSPHTRCVNTAAEEEMFAKITLTPAHFKHQQINEPDLTEKEKYTIARALFNANQYTFLSKFYKHLRLQDISCFKPDEKHIYEFAFYLNEIRKNQDSVVQCKTKKNRRYQALQKLKQSSYFSEDEMECRDPLLYEQLVGQFLTCAEKEIRRKQRMGSSDLKMSSVLLKQLDDDRVTEFKSMQEMAEKFVSTDADAGLSIHDNSASDDESELESEDEATEKKKTVSYFTYKQADWTPTDEEKAMMKEEFRDIMEARFLSGEDDYDYSAIDGNEAYDCLDTVDMDEQDKYFSDDAAQDTESRKQQNMDVDRSSRTTPNDDNEQYDY